jgi:Flp pilus assembly protein TadG
MRISRGHAIRIACGRLGLRSSLPGRHRCRGNTLIEAVFVVPVLIALGMGMVEFGQYFLAKNTLQAAARDGARTAVISSATHTQAQSAVSNTASAAGYASGGYTVTFYTLTFTDPPTSTPITNIATVTRGTPIKVTVTASFGTLAGRTLVIIPADKQVVASTTMIKE